MYPNITKKERSEFRGENGLLSWLWSKDILIIHWQIHVMYIYSVCTVYIYTQCDVPVFPRRGQSNCLFVSWCETDLLVSSALSPCEAVCWNSCWIPLCCRINTTSQNMFEAVSLNKVFFISYIREPLQQCSGPDSIQESRSAPCR